MHPNDPPRGAPAARPDRWRLRPVELWGILAFWTFFGLLGAANRLLDPRGPGLAGGISSGTLALPFFESYLWAVFTPLIFWLSSRLTTGRLAWPARLVGALATGVVLAVVIDVAGDLFRVYALDVPRWRARGVSPVRSIARLWFLDDLILFLAVLAAGLAREYFVRYRARQAEMAHLHARAGRLEAQLSEARLHALRMQVNPHFLFNTLHAIASLVERDPRGVRRMIARLSELLRYTLEGKGDQEIPLEQELDFLGKYLEIMQVRFQGKLEVEVDADPAAREGLVPNLILQPLVENAIKHGVGNRVGTGWIQVRGRREADRLLLTVRDNGPGLPEEVGEGVGLKNTRARLEQLYGSEADLTLSKDADGGVIATLEIPYHTDTDLRAAGVRELREEAP